MKKYLRCICEVLICCAIAISISNLLLKVVDYAALQIHNARQEAKMLEQAKITEEAKEPEAPSIVDEVPPQPECNIYDALPIDEELQIYTYDQCAGNGCEDYYELVLAVMWHESNFDSAAVSTTGDYGIMQINQINHSSLSKDLGISDFLDAKQNIKAGVYMLSNLLRKYDTESAALMAYNLGESGAAALWEKGIYCTKYATSVLEKKEKIKNNIYI